MFDTMYWNSLRPNCIFLIYMLSLLIVSQASITITPEVSFSLQPFPQRQEQQTEPSLSPLEAIASIGFSSLLSFYGLSLLVFGQLAPVQILSITVIRTTGYEQLERAVKELRTNYRNAMMALVTNGLSLRKLTMTVKNLKEQIQTSNKMIQETYADQQAGNISPQDARKKVEEFKKKKKISKKEIRRLHLGASSIVRIWKALDLYSIALIIRDVSLELLFVVSSIKKKFLIGYMLKSYCVFKNMGLLLLDINHNIGYPFGNVVIQYIKQFYVKNNDMDVKQIQRWVKVLGAIWVYGLCAAVTFFRKDFALQMNQSMIGAAITLRGLTSLVYRIRNKYYTNNNDNDENKDIASDFFSLKNNRFRGLFTIALTSLGVYMGRFQVQQWQLESNKNTILEILKPLLLIEKVLEKAVVFVNNILFKEIK